MLKSMCKTHFEAGKMFGVGGGGSQANPLTEKKLMGYWMDNPKEN
jgi:hypothetical protein